jgi:hypothetical protein
VVTKRNPRPPDGLCQQQSSALCSRHVAGSLTFPGYDQEPLVDLQQFSEMDWSFLVDLWASYNRFIAHVLSVLPAEAAAVVCNIGKNPPATLAWIAQDYVEHLKHHLNQVLGKTFETSYGTKAS